MSPPGRGKEQAGDQLAVSTVAGVSENTFPLAPLPQNISYNTISLQPEAQPNQPVSVPISFHGGLAYDHYDEETGGCLVNTGILCNERNVLRAPVKVNTTTLTGAAAPAMYFFEERAPNATIGRDTPTSGSVSSNTTLTISHTTGSGVDRHMLVAVASDTATYPSSVAFGETALTAKVAARSATGQVAFYTLVNPAASTTADVVITYAAATNIAAGVRSCSNVNQATPVGSFAAAIGTSAGPATDDVASVSGELVLDAAVVTNSVQTLTDDETQEEFNVLEGSALRCAGSYEAGAASVTTSWSLGASCDWGIIAVSLKPSLAPVLYANSVEDGEVNSYKVSLDDANFGTLLVTKTWSHVTTKPMGRCAEWYDGTQTDWWQPLGDNAKLQRLSAIASGSSADTWTPATDATANSRHLVNVKDQLYELHGDNEIGILDRGNDPGTNANWGRGHYVGSGAVKVTDLAQVSGLCYLSVEDGFYEFDGVGTARNILPEIGRAERNGQGLSYGRGGFFVPGVASLYWSLTGQPIGPDSFDDEHTANDPSIGIDQYFKHGRWNGTYSYNGHFYGIYVDSSGTSAFIVWAYPVGDKWRWQTIASVTADFNDFHGIYVAETSKFSASEVRPCLFFANGNDLSWIWLDKNGAPMLRRGDIDLHGSAVVISGRIDFGYPRVNKQLTYISGWAEDFVAAADHHVFRLFVYRDGGNLEQVSSSITGDGTDDGRYFTNWWTQDSNDECRSLLFMLLWTGTNSLTGQSGPRLRDMQIHAILKPATTRLWNFLISAKDDTSRTAKTIRSDLEGYLNDLKLFKTPFEDAFSGMLTDLTLLRADEINALTPRGQSPPHFIFRATVREMPSA